MVMKLSLAYEVKPYVVSQGWGEIPLDNKGNPVYAQFGFTQHNGVDVLPGHGKEVRAPFDYEVVWAKWMPNGGGNVLGVLSQNEYDGPLGKPAYVLIDFLHLESFTKFPGGVGYRGKAGDLLAIADNTGFSTGPHTHIQYRWVYKDKGGLKDVEKNKAHNSFNPEPYRSGVYAEDLGKRLEFGATGTHVRTFQGVLKTLGYFNHELTDYYGPVTQRAYEDFKKATGLVITL